MKLGLAAMAGRMGYVSLMDQAYKANAAVGPILGTNVLLDNVRAGLSMRIDARQNNQSLFKTIS